MTDPIRWSPKPGHIMTRWARDVSPERVWPEYPRPQMVRQDWLNLNGLWDYAVVPRQQPDVSRFDGQILVPFPIESALSGVKRPLLPGERLWYRRYFAVPGAWRGGRLLLHFGAVDWEATVWVNAQLVGTHRGGYDPFSFEISGLLVREGENELRVAAWDPTDQGSQERGKQVLEPGFIWYTAVSGIWQTVWLEPVPRTHIAGLKLTSDIDRSRLEVTATVEGDEAGFQVHAEAFEEGEPVGRAFGGAGEPMSLSIPSPRLWTPDTPFLYDLEVRLTRDGQCLDQIDSYFGMRKFNTARDRSGVPRLCLNNEPLFQFGPLDQGYWPDGLYTAPTDEALRFDVEVCKRLGFNMVRKHIKVEPARYYTHCDRLGLIVWQDMPNGGKPVGGVLSTVAIFTGLRLPDGRQSWRRAGRSRPASRGNYQRELRAMIDALHNHPCIGLWVPFNEGWGQFDAARIAGWLKQYDPTRPVDHASGWFDQGAGNCKSVHVYFKRLKPTIDRRRATILSEFGGYSLSVAGHVWDPQKVFGYRRFDTSADLTEAYASLLEDQLKPWVKSGLSGAVFTQTTDVEIEVNGYLTYDREIVKMDEGRITELHRSLSAD